MRGVDRSHERAQAMTRILGPVLIIEDDHDIAEVLRYVLDRENFDGTVLKLIVRSSHQSSFNSTFRHSSCAGNSIVSEQTTRWVGSCSDESINGESLFEAQTLYLSGMSVTVMAKLPSRPVLTQGILPLIGRSAGRIQTLMTAIGSLSEPTTVPHA